ncbi:putative integrase/recombinase domain protein [Synechococcus sp. A18-40]|nr:putative integrase/recombinase domain protein [Synechococcus sp. A18-40]
MDKAEALAYVSRLFDAAQAGAVLWGDNLLLKRFLAQCSRTGSKETQDGYRREIDHYVRWRDRVHPHLHLREIDSTLVEDWIAELRQQVELGDLKPRSFNRRISAISSLYRWASETTRSAVTGVPRNPVPRRTGLSAAKLAKPLSEADLTSVFGAISAAKVKGSTIAARDLVLVRGSYLIGCRVSELIALKWQDIERLETGGQIHLLGKGSKPRTVRVSEETIQLFESIGRGEPDQ